MPRPTASSWRIRWPTRATSRTTASSRRRRSTWPTGSGPAAEVTVVGSSAQQIHKFAVATGSPTAPLFDLIICDEASQTDMANALLPLATLAEHGAVVVAGDPLQLPPITHVDPPLGTEHLVGSLY